MKLYYEGSEGTIIDLMGEGIYAQSPETLISHGWNYSSISGVNGLGKIKRFYKDTEEKNLLLDIMVENKQAFDELMYHLHQTFDRDVRKMRPGKLWWNDFYKEVFVVDNKHAEFEELFESIQKEITFVSVYPYWVRENKYVYDSLTTVSGDLDYGEENHYAGFDYDSSSFDFVIAELIESIENNCINDANFEITFYGAASNPAIIIGTNEYRIFGDIANGEYIKINSVKKTITRHAIDGTEENIFHLRDKDHYIFQKIPEGLHGVTKTNSLGVDVVLFDERGEPEWI